MGGIREHDGAQVARRGRRPDGFGVPLRRQVWEPPRVVDVGVGKHHRVDLPDVEREAQVLLPGLLTVPSNMPQSSRMFLPLARTMWQEPVTPRAAPANSISIVSSTQRGKVLLAEVTAFLGLENLGLDGRRRTSLGATGSSTSPSPATDGGSPPLRCSSPPCSRVRARDAVRPVAALCNRMEGAARRLAERTVSRLRAGRYFTAAEEAAS